MGRYKGQAFTSKNGRFHTDDTVGLCTGEGSPGSMFPGALVSSKERSLWLERIIDTKQLGRECYWLMWYLENGDPELQSAPILNRHEYSVLLANLRLYLMEGDGKAPA